MAVGGRYAPGMSAEPEFRKSSFCGGGSCVEVAFQRSSFCGSSACVEVGTDGAEVLVRDSKDLTIPPLRFGAAEWDAFVEGVRAGEFGV
jgi:hypothetical protein